MTRIIDFISWSIFIILFRVVRWMEEKEWYKDERNESYNEYPQAMLYKEK